jgi:CRISPR-associated protein Csm4
MLTYRATLRPRSATRSPWQADTLFGHLCWLLRYREGESALTEFLDRYRQGQPPLLLSNGFPGGYLPRPLLPAPPVEVGLSKQAQVRGMEEAKAGRGLHWVSLEQFNALRRGEPFTPEPQPELLWRTELKNQINRLTFGTTAVDEGGGGNLYNVEELFFARSSGPERTGLDVSVYVRVEDEIWAGRVEIWLGELAQSGYGAKKSAGYGQFDLTGWQRFTDFDKAPSQANGFISLSNWVPAAADPTNGFYTRLIKYGKLGEEWATKGRPFKFPLVMLTAGSAFYAEPPLQEWYGRLVSGVDPDPDLQRPIVQYGFAFAIPARLTT